MEVKNIERKYFYVYVFYNNEWKEPFYIGKGTGDRINSNDRNKQVLAILNKYDCERRIVLNNLSEDEALRLEKTLKKQMKESGHPIIDYEKNHNKYYQREAINSMPIIDGKSVSMKTGRPTGRPPATYPDEWDKYYQMWRNGDITAKKCIELLGMKRATFYKLVNQYEVKIAS